MIMPIAVILIVGILFFETTYNKNNKIEEKNSVNVTTANTSNSKPAIVETKPVLVKEPTPIKEEVKVEPKEPVLIKEEVKVEPKEPVLVKELSDITEPKKNYLKLIIYIIVGGLAIFIARYFFSNRSSGQSVGSTADNARKDIEENIAPETEIREQEPVQGESQSDPTEQEPVQRESQSDPTEQEPVQRESQSDPTEQEPAVEKEATKTQTQEQTPAQEESQSDSAEQESVEEDENSNK
jgi:hypothetical protein